MPSAAIQDDATLFPMPEPAEVEHDAWDERAEQFFALARERGGFIPQTAAPEILGVCKQRVTQLIQGNRLEKVSYFGQNYISGRSIREFMADERVRTGRGHKKLGVWQSMVVGAKTGLAMCKSFSDET